MTEQPLPLPGYDELPVGALQHRIRALNIGELDQLIEHEHAHANRTPVLELLQHRHHELEQGATPSPGPEDEPVDTPDHQRGSSPVAPQNPRESGRPTEQGTRSSTGKGIEHP